jgi:hypothetical protein
LVDGISLTTVTGEKAAGDDGNGDESENLEAYLSVENLGIFHVALREADLPQAKRTKSYTYLFKMQRQRTRGEWCCFCAMNALFG